MLDQIVGFAKLSQCRSKITPVSHYTYANAGWRCWSVQVKSIFVDVSNRALENDADLFLI